MFDCGFWAENLSFLEMKSLCQWMYTLYNYNYVNCTELTYFAEESHHLIMGPRTRKKILQAPCWYTPWKPNNNNTEAVEQWVRGATVKRFQAPDWVETVVASLTAWLANDSRKCVCKRFCLSDQPVTNPDPCDSFEFGNTFDPWPTNLWHLDPWPLWPMTRWFVTLDSWSIDPLTRYPLTRDPLTHDPLSRDPC